MRRNSTLLEVLEDRARERAGQRLYRFIENFDSTESNLTYSELLRFARQIAVALQARGVAEGERVVLLYPPGLDYIAGFFGCLFAGAVAVPAYPPDPARLERTLPRLRAIIEDARATAVLAPSFILSMGEFLFEQAPDLKALRWIASNELPPEAGDAWRRPRVDGETLAFLQYTSGSTGTPKGVRLSHGNLLHNLGLITHAFQAHAGSRGVIWLPPYHDMGLIGGILQPLSTGFPVTLMSPLTFLKQPLRWLQAVSREGATISGGPNFAFELCIRKSTPEERRDLDLSRWEVAFCGAEPIRPETLDRFVEAFGPCGFRREAFYPCYGLAEGTLIVSGGRKGVPPVLRSVDSAALEHHRAVAVAGGAPGARILVGCGGALSDQELRIVHPETRAPCEPGTVGEIWVSGPSVAQGYWQRAKETEEAFGARLAGEGETRFLRTGDLGFFQDGELFVTGRSKDLIIIRGRNHYPQDLELAVERSHPTLRPGCGAAFSVEVDGEERLVVVQEVDPRRMPEPPGELVGAIRQRLAEEHELQLHALVLIEPGSLPKTSSGKIQRRAARADFLGGELRRVLTWREAGDEAKPTGEGSSRPEATPAPAQPSTLAAVEAWVAERISVRLRVPRDEVTPERPVTQYGLDSLAAVELAHELEQGLGVALPMEALLKGASVSGLARQLFEARARSGGGRQEPIPRLDRRDGLPLSPAQQRLWFLDQLEPQSSLYNLPGGVRLEGELDVAALERSLTEIVRRHEALRTTFQARGGQAVQVISPPSLELGRVDLRGLPDSEREAEALRQVTAQARQPFDLSCGPLLRALLLRQGEREHVLALTVHHLVSDGASWGILVRELSALYGAFSRGRPSPLPELPLQYGDYAAWQRARLEGVLLEGQLDYWRRQLAGAPRALELPTDAPRPAQPSSQGARHPVMLPRALWDALGALSRREGATPFMALLAAFQVLLHRYSGQDDLCVGAPIAGRDRPELQGLIGFFVNTLVLRGDLSGGPSFRELLGRTREAALGAYAHAEVPFERLVEALQPERDLGRTPLFQVMLTLHEPLGEALALPGLTLRSLEVHTGVAMFDLSLSLREDARGLAGAFEYRTWLFEAATIARMAEHLRVLLEGLLAAPDQPVSRLPLLTEAERRQLLVEWKGPRADFAEATLPALFEAQVERTPDGSALVFEDTRLTYRELNRRANQLAHRLRDLGVGPEVRVGVCVERSVEQVVGLLGVLKAGGAYVPLDPGYPPERLAFMAADAAAPVLLVQERLRAVVPPHQAAVVCLDPDWSDLAREPGGNPSPSARPDNLAYVLYTSGSTGRPKGAMNAHRGIVNRLRWGQEAWRLTPQDAVLQKTPFSFDVSVWELFWPLLNGARLVVARPGGHQDPAYLAELIRQQEVTTAHFVPSMLRAFLDGVASVDGSRLRRVLCSGEALPYELQERFFSRFPAVELHNLYGPTEAAVEVTSWACRPDAARRVPIGRPIANTHACVLDAGLQPVPIGVPGELYLGGVQVGRGYLGRPELTAERFLPDPFGQTSGARLYRTGDLARFLSDGSLEYLGRTDFQIKLRGFRIELGEIEAALARHPTVREAVVVAREDGGGEKRLVAYVVPAPEQQAEARALRAFLRERLPEYMLPSAFVALESLPLSPSGKLDRRALPAPAARSEEAQAQVAPRTPTEARLAELWGQVLRLERVSVLEDFFALGGHSLLATQLVSRVREAFGVELPVRAVFEAPTVASLAERLGEADRTGSGLPAPPLQPVPREGALPLSFAQQRLFFLDQLEPGSPRYTLSAVVRLEGLLDAGALEQSLGEVVRRHEALRTTFRIEEGRPVQVISPASAFTLATVDLRALPASGQKAEEARFAGEEARRPFELARGPLVRATLLRLGDREHTLLLTLHHIVTDGWSMGILVREVAALYEAQASGRPSALPELPIQYADYASWQRGWLKGEVLEAQRAYWRHQLAHLPPSLELPTDRSRPAVQTFRGASLSQVLPRSLADEVKALGQRGGATPFMVVLAAFQTLLYRYSGQADLVVGTDIANRNHARTESLIGFFVNQLVLRVQLDGALRFDELLAQVRETTLGAYAHQDLPFEELVRELNPERSLAHAPLFQVKLTYQDAAGLAVELPGLTWSTVAGDTGSAKFDLTLSVTDGAEGLRCLCEYSTDLFESDTIDRLLGHLGTLLEAVTEHPEQQLSALPLLTPRERRQLLVEWSGAGSPLSREDCAHPLFEAQVERTPDAPAATFEGQGLTYRELNRRANRLAHHLMRLGVRPEVRVALCVERSLELVVGILGILKAGGAWVPLDPTWPSDRLAFMLEDCAAPVLLTQERLADGLPSRGEQLLCLDSDSALFAAEPEGNPSAGATADNLAYIIYTSGSTGRPKGTLLHHRGLCNTALEVAKAHGYRRESRVLQFASLGFDASVCELFGTLLAGACLALAPRERLLPDAPLRALLEEQRITAVILTPTVLAQLEPRGLRALETVISAGEACSPELAARWKPGRTFINAYGPTEVTVCATLTADVAVERPGIGRPLPNVRVYVLDGQLQPVPVGVPGELCVGGVGLARGYLGRPELSAERFIPDPLGAEPGARLYRTGDLARYRADGGLEFLGRLDQQVKVRGFRIEPGEIQAVLEQHPTVAEAVVDARADGPGGKRLVAYVVGAGQVPDVGELRGFLKERLPDFMVPAAFVALEALPLTSSGKVDRRALPAPDAARPRPGKDFVAPRTPAEQQLAAIWSQVLGVGQVGLHDNFFELGGDSILSVQVIARARQVGLELTPKQLFQRQTLAELAQVAAPARAPRGEQGLVSGSVPLTPIQHAFFEREPPEAHHDNQAVLLELREPVDAGVLAQALGKLVEHHDALRVRFVRTGAGWHQENAGLGRPFSLRQMDLSQVPGGEQAAALEETAAQVQRSLRLDEGLLLRAALVHRGPGRTGRLLLVAHHLAVDGVSWRVLVEDLETAYLQLRRGEAVSLPPKTTSFKVWAEKLLAYAQSAVVGEQLTGWLEGSRPPVRALPLDASGANTAASARELEVALDAGETRLLLQEVPAAYRARIDDVLLAALARAFAQWTGEPRLRVDLEKHGREALFEDADLSRTVGWFTAVFPVLLEVPDGANPGEGLRAVRDALRRVPGGGIGYGLLRYLRPGRAAAKLEALPPAEVAFNYLGQLDASAAASALFALAPESAGPAQGERGLRSHLLEVNGRVLDGRLRWVWTYSGNLHWRETIERLAQSHLEALRSLISERGSADARRFTPADFPLAAVEPAALERLLRAEPELEDLYPLSPLQEGLLFHALLAPGQGEYLEQSTWRFRDGLDVPAFQRAWEALMARHPILRTGFAWEGLPEPLQGVRARVALPWSEQDWRGLSADEQRSRLEAFLEEDRARGFELARAPLFRLALVRLGEREFRFVWSFHHILLDGWSVGLLFEELFSSYEALRRGQPLRAARGPAFRESIAWLKARDARGDEAYWREALAGFTAPTPLPEGKPSEASGQGEREFLFPPQATAALQDFARQRQLTLNTLVQAAWALVLGRHAGERDVAFGITVAGRPPELPGVEAMVGPLINSLPVRVRLPPERGLVPWLQELQAAQVELGQHEHTPLVRIQGFSEVPRGAPLFESLLAFENYPVSASLLERVGPLGIEDFRVSGSRTHYALSLSAGVFEERLFLRLVYAARRIDPGTARQLVEQWRTALEAMVAQPEQWLGEVSLLSGAERQRLLVEWNDTRTEPARESCVHRLFEAQVERTPDAVAVVSEDRQLTYAELNRRANRLAHALRACGVGPETRVALCVERSPELVVGLLGILKAGGAYVPLEPSYPKERLAFMLEDSGARVLLTQLPLAGGLSPGGAEVLCLEAGEDALARHSEHNPDMALSPENVAYALYTSGSTGRPKGVLIPHRALGNHMAWLLSTFGLRASDRVLQKTPLSFDASVWECWAPLLIGARLVLAAPGAHRDGAALVEAVVRHQVTVLQLVPSLLRALLEEEQLPRATSLRWLFCGGEALPAELGQRLRERLPSAMLVNLYGPTEATIDATAALYRAEDTGRTVPIGRPIWNTRAYVLDGSLRPVPAGAPGELHLGGMDLARGYLGQAALTAERFVPDPFSGESGARLYRTGDRVRWLAEGHLEYLGRTDAQVKLRGFRIEPGEVEAALAAHPAVREAVVMVREDAPGVRRLVAYAVPRPEARLDTVALREHLARTLPEYVVPQAFVALEALPLMPNGKVARKALPAPEGEGKREEAQVAPRDEVERLLAGIWAQVLGREQVGIHDNFFELGGDSILSLQVVSRARQAGLSVSVRDLFQRKTVAEVARAVQTLSESAGEQGPITGPVPLLPVQQHFLQYDPAHAHHFNQFVLLTPRQPLEAPVLEEALHHLVSHHDALRLRFQQVEGRWWQDGVGPGEARPQLLEVDLSSTPPAEQARALEAEASRLQASFVLSQPPLVRAALFHLGGGQQRLLLVAHHLVVDAVSWRVLVEDLEFAWLQLKQGQPAKLPRKTTSFQDWASRLEAYARSEALASEASLWLESARRQAGALPTDSSGPNTSASERSVSVSLDADETKLLLQEVPSAWRAPINDVLLAAFAQALAEWSGHPHIRVTLEGHGREQLFSGVDLSRTVGWFTSLIPVALTLSTGCSPGDGLRAVRDALRRLPHHGIGFGLLKWLGPPELARPLQALPVPQVAFNYLGQLDASVSAGRLFSLTREPAGPSLSPTGSRMHVLEVNGFVLDGRLQFALGYSVHLHRASTMEALAQRFLHRLRALISLRHSEDARRFSPGDFPLASLSRQSLDAVLAQAGAGVEDLYPLSALQEGLLFHALLAPGQGEYIEQNTWRFRDGLDVPAFQRAWEALMERHPILRTSFVWEGIPEPLQVVHPTVALPWAELDWRGLPADEQQSRLDAWLEEEGARGFELSRAPLFRLTLVRLGERALQLVWSFHHLLLDGWSVGLLFEELFSAYDVLRKGRSLRLERGAVFREYIAWLKTRDGRGDEAYWREALAGVTAPTPLPDGRPSEAGGQRELDLVLSEGATAALLDFARRRQLTPNTLVQAAWALLLGRYAGEQDVVFGTTLAGRPPELPGVEAIVGPLINSLPVRVRLPPERGLVPWLEELQARHVELRQHEHTPLVRIQDWSQVARGTPLFESLLVFENYPVSASLLARLEPLGVEGFRAFGSRTNYALTAVAGVQEHRLFLKLAYATRRFDPATAGRLLEQWAVALEELVANPERRLSELSLLTGPERRRILVEWNQTRSEYPRESCLHELFEAQVGRTPDAVALDYDGRQLTYRELDRRANQLAHHLRSLKVEVGEVVGLYLERSVEMGVATLGILKAGAAYLPLDLSYPRERLAFMVRESRARVLVSRASLAEALPSGDEHRVLLDADGEQLARASERAFPSGAHAEHLAYVMFTSGSTGQPKGVAVTHRSVARLLLETNYIQLSASDRVAQISNTSFDAATFELWGALLHGARLVGIRRDVAISPRDFAAQLREREISVLFVTTALFNQIAREVPDAFRSLRQVHFGGEAVDPRQVREVLEKGPPERLLHVYGPTESTTFALWHRVEQVEEGATTVPLGRPLANTEVYLLDARLQPVSVGMPGELYLGGDGLARGYLHRPELTAERFIPNPFGARPGERVYRTGDLACYLPDGSIEFRGRRDAQVKVRGFRIEPGEIEAALGEHPAVREAVVVVREDVPGDKRLVAYAVPQPGARLDAMALRQHLARTLPEYMVPQTFVALDGLPLTPNGKVDRKALPAPEGERQVEGAWVAPRNEVEALLAGIWAEVLRVERPGVEDSFFALGGHSLLATQAVSRIRGAFGVELPLRELFENPTVAGLARRVEAAVGARQGLSAPPLLPVPRTGKLSLSFAQQRLWFLDQLEPGSAFYNVSGAVRLEGPLDVAALERSFQELVRRHEALRTTFESDGAEPAQFVGPAAAVPLHAVELQALPGAEREAELRRLAAEEAARPFDLARGPLLRVLLLKPGEQDHVLLLTVHHIVSDGWSLGILIRELDALYRAFSAGQPSPLPEPSLQSADFAVWQRGWLRGEVLEAQLSYWRQQLGGAPRALELPTDRPRPAVQMHRGAARLLQLPKALAEGLRALSQREGVTSFMALLAAYQALLSRYSGQEDVSVGSPIAGRNRVETEGLIGCFVNTLVLRTRLSGNPTFRELLARVREVTLGAYAHQDVPFEKLVEALQPERDLSRSPLFQVTLTLQNTPEAALDRSGLRLRPFEVESGTAKYELVLILEETPEGLEGALGYNTDLFDADTVARLVGHLRTLLEGAIAQPEQRLAELPLLSEAERRQVLVDFNDTAVAWPREASIPSLFEAQVERAPEAIAVELEGERLTYRELNARANRLAHHLRSCGIRPGALVGLCLERSLELIVGILAILKAGGAYVPLDPTWPQERLALMLRDARAQVVLTREALAGELPSQGELLVCIDSDGPRVAGCPEGNPVSGITGDDLAYVMFTSGSTGQPKGVCVPHRGVVRLVMGSTFAQLSDREVFLQLAPASFDASTFELWGALLHGAKLVVFPPHPPTLEELGQVLGRYGITTLWLTAALFEQMAAIQPGALGGLRQLLAGGDVLPPGRAREYLARGGVLINGYGPTESTTFAACYRMTDPAQVGPSVSIGRPIANTQGYVLDGHLHPVPVGVPGELYLGGDGLAVGYLGEPGLTAGRFIPHPFSGTPGARLYRTGDLARWLPDGRLEFLGRRDSQVKVRGFRVELGEVEAALGQAPQVREAVVVGCEDGPGGRRLVAYVVGEGTSPDVAALRRFLEQRLPGYMVPPAFVVLDALPLTPHGKVDRKALPEPDAARPDLEQAFVAPRNPTEELLAGIWVELLGVDRVGIHDSFFDLGGHSLLATQAVTRIRSAFGVELPLRDLFEAPTVERLALRILQLQAGQLDAGRLEELLAELEQASEDPTSEDKPSHE